MMQLSSSPLTTEAINIQDFQRFTTLFLSFSLCLYSCAVIFQLPHSSLGPRAFWGWAESVVLEGARKLETLCRSVEDTLKAPFVQVGADGAQIFAVSQCVLSGCLSVQILLH